VIDASAPKLELNPYSWHMKANIVYLETPSPVGFSYGGNYTTGDDETAKINLEFLQKFLELYTEFQGADFYITGYSYAGQYIPQLSQAILSSENGLPVKFVGIMMGNPSGLAPKTFADTYWAFMNRHGIISDAQFETLNKYCEHTPFGPRCTELRDEIYASNIYGTNPYNILNLCLGPGPGDRPECMTVQMPLSTSWKDVKPNNTLQQSGSACLDYSTVTEYLNRDDVKEALHISDQAFPWDSCTSNLHYVQVRHDTPSLYETLAPQLKILVYSGDQDSCLPYLGTMSALSELDFVGDETDFVKWTLVDPISNTSQTVGVTKKYGDNVSFYTVKGGGHMTPTDKPIPMLQLFSNFIGQTQ